MLVSRYVIKNVPGLELSTALADIIPEEYPPGLVFAPVLENGQFLGFLDIEDLESMMDEHEKVADCPLEKVSHLLREDQHLFEALPFFEKTGLPVLPVIDAGMQFSGVLEISAAASAFLSSYSFQTEGGSLVLSIPAIQYSLSELSRLVEANQGKVLSVLLEADPVLNQNYLVHLKINQPDLSRIVATLERFDYNVLEVHQTLEASSIDKDRFDQLMRYLGI